MNDFTNSVQVVPALIGTMSVISGTATGAPVNCLGFQGVLAIATVGGIHGSTGATVNLAIKFQESTTIGGTYTDITNEAVSQGSFNLDTITLGDSIAGGTTTGTWIPYESVKKYCRLSDGNRKQWIRAHATLSGTVGLGPKISVVMLLEKPVDTYYVSSAVVVPSGNIELSKLI